MASNITSAGAASGMDFESIISASVQAKKSQLAKQTTTRKEETNITLSGVGKLKTALETFQSAVKALTEDNGFNTRKVTTNQPTDNPYMTITTKDDAANGNYDIKVEQLSSTEKISTTIDKDAKFSAGTIKITLPGVKTDETSDKEPEPRVVEIKIDDGDTLELVRKKINQKAGDLGVSASIISTKDGNKLTIDSGLSGAENDGQFKMEFTPSADADSSKSTVNSGDYFNYNSADAKMEPNEDGNPTNATTTVGKWTKTFAKDAIINVDGDKIHSATNEFNNSISGLKITVNRVHEADSTTGEIKPTTVTVGADVDGVTKKMQDFVTAYNTLQDTMDSLYKQNTYTDGQNNYDGGELAGDSMLRSLQTQLQSMMTSMTASKGTLDIYTVGMEVDKEGKLSLDTTKFKENITDNFNAVVNIFTGTYTNAEGKETDGILTQYKETIELYTKSGGILSEREDQLNATIKQYEAKEAQNEEYLAKYEENLRQRYSKLDTTIASYNNSLVYLQSALA